MARVTAVLTAARANRRRDSSTIPLERDSGSETGANKGRSITRDAAFSAGFVNPGPT